MKKRTKQLFALFLSTAMIFALIPATSLEAEGLTAITEESVETDMDECPAEEEEIEAEAIAAEEIEAEAIEAEEIEAEAIEAEVINETTESIKETIPLPSNWYEDVMTLYPGGFGESFGYGEYDHYGKNYHCYYVDTSKETRTCTFSVSNYPEKHVLYIDLRDGNGKILKSYQTDSEGKFSITDTYKRGETYYYTVHSETPDEDASSFVYYNYIVDDKYVKAPEMQRTSAGVEVTWNTMPTAEKIRIYRGTGDWEKGLTWVRVADVDAEEYEKGKTQTYLDKGAPLGTTYYYGVRAVNSDGSAFTSKLGTSYNCIQPFREDGKTYAVNSAKGVKISWDTTPVADGYMIFRGVGSYGTTKEYATVKGATTSLYIDTNVTSGTNYYYFVRPYIDTTKNGVTNRSWATYDDAFIQYAASPVVTFANTSKGLLVRWNKIAGANSYIIYRKYGTGSYSRIATINDGNTLSYTDTAVASKNGYSFTYAVRAVTGQGLSSFVAKPGVRLVGTLFTSVTSGSAGALTMKWTTDSKASGYQIQYSRSSTFSNAKLLAYKGSSTRSKTIYGLTRGKVYYTRIRTFKTVNGVNYYSTWRSLKSAKIK